MTAYTYKGKPASGKVVLNVIFAEIINLVVQAVLITGLWNITLRDLFPALSSVHFGSMLFGVAAVNLLKPGGFRIKPNTNV